MAHALRKRRLHKAPGSYKKQQHDAEKPKDNGATKAILLALPDPEHMRISIGLESTNNSPVT